MNYKLHYAPLDLNGQDIKELSFNSKTDMALFVRSIVLPAKLHADRVYLCAFPEDEIIVSEDEFFVLSLFEKDCHYLDRFFTGVKVENGDVINFPNEYFLQEYSSYEDAYKSALEMKEPNPLCYNK